MPNIMECFLGPSLLFLLWKHKHSHEPARAGLFQGDVKPQRCHIWNEPLTTSGLLQQKTTSVIRKLV